MVHILFLIPPNKKNFIRDTQYGCWHEKKWIDYSWPPLALYQIAALFDDAVVLDAAGLKLTEEETLHKIKNINPSFIAVNTGTYVFSDDVKFLKKAKEITNAKIILFGQHPTTCPKECLDYGWIDFVVRGEPESVINQLIKNHTDTKKLKLLSGVCFKNHISRKKAVVNDLDSLPFPRRDISSINLYKNPFAKKRPFATTLTTRGCPFDCIFCTVPVLYGKRFRKRSTTSIITELRMLKKQGFKEIFFRDENITLDRTHITSLCNSLTKEKLKLSWMCNSRVDTVNKNILSLMKKSGCHMIKFGVESSDEKILKNIKKGITTAKIRETFRLCKELKIETVAHFMIGNPGETEESILKTIDFAKKLNPTYSSFDMVLKYPGTEISNAKRVCNLTRKELNYWHNRAFKEFYLRPAYIIRNILNIKSLGEFKDKFYATLQLWRSLLFIRRKSH